MPMFLEKHWSGVEAKIGLGHFLFIEIGYLLKSALDS